MAKKGERTSENDLRAIVRWTKANTKTFMIRLNHKTDADIITWLDAQPSKSGRVKELIRADIESGK